MRVGFIGLGMMGKPIAVNLVRGGHDVAVANRSQGKVQELAAMGARAAVSPADAARDAEVVALCLVEDDVVERVLLGRDGALSTAGAGAVVLDHSTVHPRFARRMEQACAERGVAYLDAPVSGSGQVAWDGKLTVMAGGDAEAFARVRPILDVVSANALLLGSVGSGNMAKLINNMVKDINLVAVMEAFVLAAKLGMDCWGLFETLRRASAASRQLERLAPKVLDRSFTQTTYVSTNIKDQAHTQWLIDQAGVELPLRDAARDFWLRAAEEGFADADSSEAIRVLEREAGIEVAGSPSLDGGEGSGDGGGARGGGGASRGGGEGEAGGAASARAGSGERAGLRVAFIGLGMMGRPIAENLVRAGFDVTVVNRSQGKVEELAALGARAGASPADAASDADVIALCLSGEETIDLVLRGKDGALSTVRPGAIVLDHSTVRPEFARELAAACAAQGVVYLDAPVSGTGRAAWEGRLAVMVGGDGGSFERVRPVLGSVSSYAALLGAVGSGSFAKLMNNMIADAYQVGIMEAFVLASKLGMDVGALFEAMRTASAATRQLERIGPKILDRDFAQTSQLSGHARGQGIMGGLAREAGVRLALREVVEDVWRRGEEAGLGSGDPARVVTLYELAAGVEVRRSRP